MVEESNFGQESRQPIPHNTDSVEPVNTTETLDGKHKDNLSLYSPEEELAALEALTTSFECTIIPIEKDGVCMGYFIGPSDPKKQQEIVADAPITMVDYDDTQAKTTQKKYESWERMKSEEVGIPMNLIKLSDKLSRITFDETHGKILEPELDMRLLTYALKHQNDPEVEKGMSDYLKILLSYESMTELKEREPVNEGIRTIFDETRFSVELYPDTEEVLKKLRKPFNVLPASNLFLLTYGDCPFQAEKVLPLLERGLVHGIILTKAKKGPLIEALFDQNPFIDLAISSTFPEAKGKGIPIKEFGQPLILLDDDPSQVSSFTSMQEIMGIPLAGGVRVRSDDQKRANIPTDESGIIVEMPRDDEGRLKVDIKEIQADLTAEAIEQWLAGDIYDFHMSELLFNLPSGFPELAITLYRGAYNMDAFFDACVSYRLIGRTEYPSEDDCIQKVYQSILEKYSHLFD